MITTPEEKLYMQFIQLHLAHDAFLYSFIYN
jgi:hypothetical protein